MILAMNGDPVKVVETQVVTDEELERIINTWIARDYVLDNVLFAMRDASRRPAMAFLVFFKKSYVKGQDQP